MSEGKTYLAVRTNLGLLLGLLLRSNGPVNQEEVNVIELQVLQRVVERPLNILGPVQMVPDFSAHEKVLTLDRGVFLEEVLDRLANLILVQVEPSTIQVSVTGTETMECGLVRLALVALTREGTEANTRNGNSVAELERLAVRHDRAIIDGRSVDKRRNKVQSNLNGKGGGRKEKERVK